MSEPSSDAGEESVRSAIDLVVGVLLLFVGIAGVVSGTLISAVADREIIAELVAEDVIHSTVMNDADLVEFVYVSVLYGGIGVAVAGGSILLIGVLFGVTRYRAHRRNEPHRSVFADAMVGAVVTYVTSFVPFSPVIGGGVAGYLEGGGPWRGVRGGLLVGILVTIPVFVALAVLAYGLVEAGLVWASLALVFLGVLLGGVTIVLGAVGGYIGGYVRRERED